jgi:hypothetical protein
MELSMCSASPRVIHDALRDLLSSTMQQLQEVAAEYPTMIMLAPLHK